MYPLITLFKNTALSDTMWLIKASVGTGLRSSNYDFSEDYFESNANIHYKVVIMVALKIFSKYFLTTSVEENTKPKLFISLVPRINQTDLRMNLMFESWKEK